MGSNVEEFDDQPFRDKLLVLLMAKRPKECMRGLRSRMLRTKGRIMRFFNQEDAAHLLFMAGLDAMQQGRQDARDANHRHPLLFTGEAYLLRCWRSGYDGEIRSQEMWGCRQWHDGSGKTCPIHG
ncbi:MAG: hypothetical protein K2X78_15075 [Burkholderiaceae bacterium]|nr:hypothetical protein [Burkholderiaceae bacterium]